MKKTPLLLAFCVLLTGCLIQKTDTSPVLARFDGTVITKNQYLNKLQSLSKDLQAAVNQRKKEFLEDMTSEHFLMKEAVKRGVDKDEEVKDLIETARKKIIVAKQLLNFAFCILIFIFFSSSQYILIAPDIFYLSFHFHNCQSGGHN